MQTLKQKAAQLEEMQLAAAKKHVERAVAKLHGTIKGWVPRVAPGRWEYANAVFQKADGNQVRVRCGVSKGCVASLNGLSHTAEGHLHTTLDTVFLTFLRIQSTDVERRIKALIPPTDQDLYQLNVMLSDARAYSGEPMRLLRINRMTYSATRAPGGLEVDVMDAFMETHRASYESA